MENILKKMLCELKKTDKEIYLKDINNIYNSRKNDYLTFYDFLDDINYYFYNKELDDNEKNTFLVY